MFEIERVFGGGDEREFEGLGVFRKFIFLFATTLLLLIYIML
jgi:hypothetical protein